jgi:hypothetical protein
MPDTSPEPPRKVALFSGHMIDAPGREKPRFPPDKEPIAARAIAEPLAPGGPYDLRRACGGDLLFAEAALARSARLELHIPFEEPTFLGYRSVSRNPPFGCGGDWRRHHRSPSMARRPAGQDS